MPCRVFITALVLQHFSLSFPTTLRLFFPQGSRFTSTPSPTKTLMRRCESLPRKSMFPLSRLKRLSEPVSPQLHPQLHPLFFPSFIQMYSTLFLFFPLFVSKWPVFLAALRITSSHNKKKKTHTSNLQIASVTFQTIVCFLYLTKLNPESCEKNQLTDKYVSGVGGPRSNQRAAPASRRH